GPRTDYASESAGGRNTRRERTHIPTGQIVVSSPKERARRASRRAAAVRKRERACSTPATMCATRVPNRGGHECCAEGSGKLLPPSPPAEKATDLHGSPSLSVRCLRPRTLHRAENISSALKRGVNICQRQF